MIDKDFTMFNSPTLLLLSVSVLLFFVYIGKQANLRRLPINSPAETTGNYPIIGATGFWIQRWDWFRRQRDQSKTGNFSFHAGANTIVGLSGDKCRKLFFESRGLSFSEGYAVLFGQAPKVKSHDDGDGKDDELNNHFHRRIVFLLKNEQLDRRLPTLISDIQDTIDAIRNDPSGVTNPFESIYRIVFRLTIRMVGAAEMADDPVMLEEVLKLFETIDGSATAASVMFPKLPSPALLKRSYAGAQLYYLVENILKKRAASDEKHDDALQYLLDQGDRTFKIVEFIIGALFAGLLNSGINAAWVLCFLAASPEWLSKTQQEIQEVAAKYARDPNAPLRNQLDDIPLEAWESEFPVVDMCLRDSIRLNLLGTAMRKNISGKAIPTGNGNEIIPPDAIVTYAIADIHLDPEIYSDPHKWDPSRYLPERAEDKKNDTHSWLGWGSGRHPCLGRRFAQLEQNLITAYFVASFDFQLEDKHGDKMPAPPQIDANGHTAHKPKTPLQLRVTPKEK
ncbi:cytochrome P450 6A1 [Phaeosphaeriaceae sp. PMI808]|nr:cytochrome P450 6A1 [Phaeosphaeriaceae sp. PMI808]